MHTSKEVRWWDDVWELLGCEPDFALLLQEDLILAYPALIRSHQSKIRLRLSVQPDWGAKTNQKQIQYRWWQVRPKSKVLWRQLRKQYQWVPLESLIVGVMSSSEVKILYFHAAQDSCKGTSICDVVKSQGLFSPPAPSCYFHGPNCAALGWELLERLRR